SKIEKFIQRNAKTDICRSWRFLIRDLFYSPFFVVTKHPQEAAGDRFFRCNLKCRFEYTANYQGKSFVDKPGKGC
ncbi:hypothetical protein, partial [Roseburia amylophila]